MFEGEGDTSDKPVELVRVCSEKELTKEMENISAMLSSEQEWLVRMAAMQRIEGLTAGGQFLMLEFLWIVVTSCSLLVSFIVYRCA